jgi:3-methylcrotonyl-CoA carboxylase beta subunit
LLKLQGMDLEFEKNKDHNSLLLNELQQIFGTIKKGGGKARLEKIRASGKMTARERIAYLVDPKAPVLEIGGFAAHDMYEEEGGCPAAGVIVVLSKIANKWCVIVANDASVKAGAWFPMTAKKNLRAQEIALENKIPIIYLVDSAGVYLPMQDEIFPDKEHFGRIFRNNAQLSSAGIVQIAAVMGSCVAGGAYLPIMSDEAIIVEGIFLAGSYLVKAAIGESIANETLGGATTHTAISGVADYKAKNDQDALDRIRKMMGKLGDNPLAGFNREKGKAPKNSPDQLLGLLPAKTNKAYDTYGILESLVDSDSMEEYKADYGKTLITTYARIDGWAVGIIANQRAMVKNAKGELQFGGVIYSDSADKATRFIANCNQRKIPLVFLQDVTGFMVGSKAEHGGIIKDGAKMVNAVANSVVPKFTVVIGNSFGAGNYAMCGKAYDPRMMLSWPTAKMAVMGGQQAANVLLQIEKSKMEKEGKKISSAKEKELLQTIEKRYQTQTKPLYAAARLWTDAIIDPATTREWISAGIEIANHAPIDKAFNMGVLQV